MINETISKKKMTRMFLIGPVVGAMLGVGVLIGCAGDIGLTEGRNSGGEHGGRTEVSEVGSEGTEGRSGGEEDSGAMLAPDETFDEVRGGARLILNYDATGNAFIGTVENTTTGNTLTNVRIEVHLSNGTELGPTTPIDMAPGEMAAVNLPSTAASFTGWVAHAEVGGGEGSQAGGEGSGEHGGSGRERRGGG